MKGTRLSLVVVALILVVALVAACSSTPASSPQPGATSTAKTSSSPVAQSGQTYNWRLQSIYPPSQYNYKLVDEVFIPMIAQLTNNRIKITQYPPASLAPSAEILGALGAAQFEMADFVTIYNIGIYPEGNLEFPMPGGFRDPVVARGFSKAWEPIAQEAINEKGVQRLFTRSLGTWYGSLNAKPIAGIADMKGKKLRTTGLYSNVASALGASPTTLALEDIYTALTLGTVDGQTYSGPQAWLDNKFVEPAKYVVYPPEGGIGGGSGLGINLKLWNSLTPDLQAALITAATFYGEERALLTNIKDEEALNALLTTYGGKILTWSVADVETYKQTSMKVWDEQIAAKNARCAKGVQMYKDWMNKQLHPLLWLPRDTYIGMK